MKDRYQMALYDAELMYQQYCSHADKHLEIQRAGMLKTITPLTKGLVEAHIRVLEEIVSISKQWARKQTDDLQEKIREISKLEGDHAD